MDFSECLGTERLTKTYTRLGSLYQCTEQKLGMSLAPSPSLNCSEKVVSYPAPEAMMIYLH